MPPRCLPFRTAMVAALIAGFAGPARAATATDPTAQDERSDRVEDRDEALEDAAAFKRQHEPAVVSSPAFEVRIDAPLYYDSNAQELQRGASAALEGNPEATFGWKHPSGRFRSRSACSWPRMPTVTPMWRKPMGTRPPRR